MRGKTCCNIYPYNLEKQNLNLNHNVRYQTTFPLQGFEVSETYSFVHGLCFTFTSEHLFANGEEFALPLLPGGEGVVAFYHEKNGNFFLIADAWLAGAAARSEEFEDESLTCFIELEVI